MLIHDLSDKKDKIYFKNELKDKGEKIKMGLEPCKLLTYFSTLTPPPHTLFIY